MEHTLTLSRAQAALRRHDLLIDALCCPEELTFPVLTYDSRAVCSGALFICKGLNFKPEYLQKALASAPPAMWRSSPMPIMCLLLSSVMHARRFRSLQRNITITLPSGSPLSG